MGRELDKFGPCRSCFSFSLGRSTGQVQRKEKDGSLVLVDCMACDGRGINGNGHDYYERELAATWENERPPYYEPPRTL